MIPEHLRYTDQHEWVTPLEESPVRVGITHYAQDALGDIVFVTLPEVGTEVRAGESFGEVESTKSVSELYAPVSGRVSARNSELSDHPELINSDPYGAGWLIEIEPSNPDEASRLLDAAAYARLTEQ
ncbi:MAG TPA: glycine cleavage system protein GcvH [Natronosporangium sp.]